MRCEFQLANWAPFTLMTLDQAKTVVAPLDRVKILFQASNPEFQKYAGNDRLVPEARLSLTNV